MSVITQFFPSGGAGGGGGNETPTGISVPADGIPVEILGVSGAGGPGGSTSGYDGQGGFGAIFHATNYAVQPGCTVPITIGAGGAQGSQCPNGQGSQGGATSFNYPVLPISVDGGGGGSNAVPCCRNPYGACPGGTGGGSMFNISCPGTQTICAGEGKYYQQKTVTGGGNSFCWRNNCSWASQAVFKSSEAKMMKYHWGVKGGFPGLPAVKTPGAVPSGCYCCCGFSGRNAGNVYRYCCLKQAAVHCEPTWTMSCSVCVNTDLDYRSDIQGGNFAYGSGSESTFGYVSSNQSAGCAGGLIIKWADAFGASPPTGFPGATDISPDTPGYYTYCFTTSGSIELP